jgi:hypothetical protein
MHNPQLTHGPHLSAARILLIYLAWLSPWSTAFHLLLRLAWTVGSLWGAGFGQLFHSTAPPFDMTLRATC